MEPRKRQKVKASRIRVGQKSHKALSEKRQENSGKPTLCTTISKQDFALDEVTSDLRKSTYSKNKPFRHRNDYISPTTLQEFPLWKNLGEV